YGINFMETIERLVFIWIVPVCGLLTSIFIGWVLDRRIAASEFHSGTKWHFLFKPWFFFMRYIVPLTIVLIIVQKSGLVDFDKYIRF
ncbi:MAG: sodium-dependent transporter, partial [Simkaniaceae bacterium]|nr:sodium-dependent transporter [Simkaniaceae bacterium]